MEIQWQKSSFSTNDDDNCIELASDRGDILLRESTNPEVVVRTSPAKLRAFLAGAKAGEFDDLP